MVIVRAMADQEHDAVTLKARNEIVQEGLRNRVARLQLIEDHKQRLDFAFVDQELEEGVQTAAEALRRLKASPFLIGNRNIEQCQKRYDKRRRLSDARRDLADPFAGFRFRRRCL
jgi:hypothetical protein